MTHKLMRILLVEDEPDLASPLVTLLKRELYDVKHVETRSLALEASFTGHFDLAVLDVMLPDGPHAGFELAESLRAGDFEGRILFLTARDSVDDRIRGLDSGGDDYLVKPFSLREFAARVRTLLRRDAGTRAALFERGSLKVDLGSRRVFWQGEEVSLTQREFSMIELFALYPGRVFTVDDLRRRFFPEAASGQRVVRVYVSQLRQKLGEAVLTTVSGGYRLDGE
ncbi:MAG TPA: response regulator transcription factor [Trueperaceae bacterium]